MATERRVATGFYVILAAGALSWWMWLGRGTTFFFDEWNFVLAYNQSLWSAMITPHVGQLVAVPVIVYRSMFALVGLTHYWPYRLVGLICELGMGTAVFFYLSGRIRPLLALIGALALLASGQAFQDILWPFELTFTVSLAFGVVALILMGTGSKAGAVGASICLAVSVASSGLGLVFLTGIAAEVIWSAVASSCGPERQWARLAGQLLRVWVVLPGLVLYLTWYFYEHVGDAVLSRLSEVPVYVAASAGYAVGSLLGLRSLAAGAAVAFVLAVIVVARLVFDWRTAGRLVMALVAGLTFWTLAALARGEGAAGSSRYLQPDGLFVVLALAELGTGRWAENIEAFARDRLWINPGHRATANGNGSRGAPARSLVRRGTVDVPTAFLASCALIAVLAGLSNSVTLIDGSRGLRADSLLVKGDLRAVELAGNRLPSSLQPVPVDAPQIYVGQYLDAIGALGSPADSNAQLADAPETVRASADALLVMALRPSVTPVRRSGSPPSVAGSVSELLSARCAARGNGSYPDRGSVLELRFGPSGVLVSAPSGYPVDVRLRLLASQYPSQPTAVVPAGTLAIVAPRALMPHLPASSWWAELTVPDGRSMVACPL